MNSETSARERLRTIWSEVGELVAPRRGRLAAGAAMMLVGRGAGLVPPAATKYLVDDVVGRGRADLLPILAFAIVGGSLVHALSTFALSQFLGVAAHRVITDVRRRVEQHVVRLPVSYFESATTGSLISRIMNDAEGIRNLIGNGIVQFFGSLVTATLALVVLLWLDWKLTLVALTALGIAGIVVMRTLARIRPLFRERSEIQAQVSGRLAEALAGIRIVKAYTNERREDRVFASGVHDMMRKASKTITAAFALSAFMTLVGGTLGAFLTYAGGRAILAGAMTLGELVMYVFFLGLLIAPAASVASIGAQITEAFAGLDRIREVLGEPTELQHHTGRAPAGAVEGRVDFQNVWFEYEPGIPVLRNVSFTAPAHTTTALVGRSGSGKSTLTSLIMSFARPSSGRVLVDGRDLATIALRDYRSHLGVVLQDNFLFDATVAENIRYGYPGATDEQVLIAARVAHVDEFVEPLEKQYDTIIGERGIKLSGGQRQRIAIARALLADPAILILDEATSSLDSESEAKIQDGLRALRKGRTTFVIAHRLSTIAGADQILVLDAGEVVERGTHLELLARNGRYRQLYRRQHTLEIDRFLEDDGDAEVVEPAGTGSDPV